MSLAVASVPALLLAAWPRREAPPAESARPQAGAAADGLSDPNGLEESLDAIGLGILILDPEGRVLRANPALRELLGWAGGKAGVAGATLLPEPAWARLLERLLAGETFSAHWPPDGQGETHLQLRGRPLAGGRFLLTAEDVSLARRRAERGRDLVANVSHELKTPLTAIRGAAETLRDGALAEPEAAERFILRILEQCERLEALLKDLLTLSYLEGSAAEPRSRPLDLAALARDSLDLLRPMAAQGQVDLQLRAAETLPMLGDANALERMLLNLLENAIKYNRPGGQVVLRLEARPERVEIELADTGIGIPDSARERIFERFFRVDKGRSRGQGGTGLGLAIVKHVVKSHGGSVTVESELGRGSRFTLSLPRGQQPEADSSMLRDKAEGEGR